MDYLRVPSEISLDDIRCNGFSLSPANYRGIELPNAKVLQQLLEEKPIRGIATPNMAFIKRAPCLLITNKALQVDSYIVDRGSSGVIPLKPKFFHSIGLRDKDILFSTNVNIGEASLLIDEHVEELTMSPWMVVLRPLHKWYVYAFLKHRITRDQMESLVPKGSIFRNAGDQYLTKLLIPLPNRENGDLVIRYVSSLMQAIADKEKEIHYKNTIIDKTIENELVQHQKSMATFTYSLPTIKEIRGLGRLDVGMYSEDFKRKQFLIMNYERGSADYEDWGFEIGRGQNLQISCIGKSIYSDEAKQNFYRLVAPTDISEYRTVQQFRYLGNKKELSLLKQGDVVFGAEGFCKGRAVILADEVQKTISNIHGVIFHPKDGSIIKGIFLGCFLGYLRSIGLVDAIGAGGSGGSLAIGYFHHVPIPKFSIDKQSEIARLYENQSPPPPDIPTLDTFVDWHRRWNAALGIWELDREMKALQRTLTNVQERIIEGKTVAVP